MPQNPTLFMEAAMKIAIAFLVGVAVLWLHENHTFEFWHIVKAVVVGGFVLLFFQKGKP